MRKATCDVDKQIVQTLALGMTADADYLVIRYHYGFELFGSYETWAGGYIVEDKFNNIQTSDRLLDVAVSKWARLLASKRANHE